MGPRGPRGPPGQGRGARTVSDRTPSGGSGALGTDGAVSAAPAPLPDRTGRARSWGGREAGAGRPSSPGRCRSRGRALSGGPGLMCGVGPGPAPAPGCRSRSALSLWGKKPSHDLWLRPVRPRALMCFWGLSRGLTSGAPASTGPPGTVAGVPSALRHPDRGPSTRGRDSPGLAGEGRCTSSQERQPTVSPYPCPVCLGRPAASLQGCVGLSESPDVPGAVPDLQSWEWLSLIKPQLNHRPDGHAHRGRQAHSPPHPQELESALASCTHGARTWLVPNLSHHRA